MNQFLERDWPDDVRNVVGNVVDFHLSYKGRLPSIGDVKVKDSIRRNINDQLWELVKYEPRLRPELDTAVYADLKGRRLSERALSDLDVKLLRTMGKGDGTPGLLVVELNGRVFCPLIDRRRSLVCHLDIKLLSRDDVRGIVHGGDLDNRMKTLFDALRIPQHEDEVPGKGMGIFPTLCLLEDDSLITKLSIVKERLLDPIVDESEYLSDVRLEIAVSIKPRGGSDHWMGQP